MHLKVKEHRLLLEIRQQPEAIIETVKQRNAEFESGSKFLRNGTCFLGMGSSFCASLYAKYILREVANIEVGVELSSEFLHYPPKVRRGQVFVLISQSGESVETVKAAQFLRRQQATVIGVTNQAESSLVKLSRRTLLTHAGEERASATKTFTSTLALLHRLAYFAGKREGRVTPDRLANSYDRLVSCANLMQTEIPRWEQHIRRMVDQTRSHRSIVVLGRGYNLATALQGALELKEVVKIPAEGMSAGEFMHGPIEMASPELQAIILTGGPTSSLMTGLAKRLKKYHATVLTIGPESAGTTNVIRFKEKEQTLIPFPSIVALDLLVYFTALKRPLDPDKLRHISKVTLVE